MKNDLRRVGEVTYKTVPRRNSLSSSSISITDSSSSFDRLTKLFLLPECNPVVILIGCCCTAGCVCILASTFPPRPCFTACCGGVLVIGVRSGAPAATGMIFRGRTAGRCWFLAADGCGSGALELLLVFCFLEVCEGKAGGRTAWEATSEAIGCALRLERKDTCWARLSSSGATQS